MNAMVDDNCPTNPQLTTFVTMLRQSIDDIVADAVGAIWSQVPAYATAAESHVHADTIQHVHNLLDSFLAVLSDARPIRSEHFAASATAAQHRLREGIELPDFLRAFVVGQMSIWDSVQKIARRESISPDITLATAGPLLQFVETSTSVAAQAYLTAQQHQLTEIDRRQRELVEDLLAGRALTDSRATLLRSVGITTSTQLIVASVMQIGAEPDEQSLTASMMAIRSAGSGLAVVLREEIVAVFIGAATESTIRNLTRTLAELAGRGSRFAVGVSTVHTGPDEIAAAYTEACQVRRGLRDTPGILALSNLSTFDYLILRDDPTVRRLVQPDLRRFIENDITSGHTLIDTFHAYIAADLNAKDAADQLNLHVNTAYNRLDRIATKTGRNLRAVSDVLEILIAIRLLDHRPLLPGGNTP
ncbi:PucR family transcriptional regulator [Nocardia sp. NPDC088792]|uniref:PucR family transcriptional regulator n=1 Tax=Nocardia sp. NPDC088792 TaxID=3364332 RepID=UPI0037F6D36B